MHDHDILEVCELQFFVFRTKIMSRIITVNVRGGFQKISAKLYRNRPKAIYKVYGLKGHKNPLMQ